MSKVTARAHQPTTVLVRLTAPEVRLLARIRKHWCADQTQFETVAQVVIGLGLLHWEAIRPTILADMRYMEMEGLPNCKQLWAHRLRQKAARKFVA